GRAGRRGPDRLRAGSAGQAGSLGRRGDRVPDRAAEGGAGPAAAGAVLQGDRPAAAGGRGDGEDPPGGDLSRPRRPQPGRGDRPPRDPRLAGPVKRDPTLRPAEASGDPLAETIARMTGPLRAYFRKRTRNEHEAEDLVQEVFY